MLRSRILLLLMGLLLLGLGTVIVGGKLRGGSVTATPLPTLSTTQIAEDGRVSGYDDDPVVVYCKAVDGKIEAFRIADGTLQRLHTFAISEVTAAAPDRLSVQLDSGDLLTLAQDR